MRSIRPGHKVSTAQKPGCAEVRSCSRHWLCLFPQYGAGRKNVRTIELQPWQRAIVRAHPGPLARGLFSLRWLLGINRVHGHLADGDRWQEYPRYMFTNESRDILRVRRGEVLTRPGQEGSGMG